MRFIIETNLASKPAWWLLDDDNRVLAKTGGRWRWTAWRPEGVRVAISADWFPSEEAARHAARLVQQQACTAIGP